MSIQSEITRLGTAKSNIAAAIAKKGVEVPAGTALDGMAALIESIQEGVGGSGGSSDEGWIGDGNTHIWISLAEGRTSPMLGCCPKGTVTVDWGDGTTPDVLTGTSTTSVKWTPTHHYAAGDYVITLAVDGDIGFYGSGTNNAGSALLRHSSANDNRNYGYRTAIQKIECGDDVTSFGNYTFGFCYGLASIKISDSLTSIGNYAFSNCYGFASITIPNSVTSIGNYAFYQCYGLASITIPDGVTSIGNSAFGNCYSLASITIPDSVTSIGTGVFGSCYGLAKMRFKSATPPTVANSNAFTGIPADCIISVPVGSLAAYTSATNYPSSSTYTYIEED